MYNNNTQLTPARPKSCLDIPLTQWAKMTDAERKAAETKTRVIGSESREPEPEPMVVEPNIEPIEGSWIAPPPPPSVVEVKLSEKAQSLKKLQEERQSDITVLQEHWKTILGVDAPTRDVFYNWHKLYGFEVITEAIDAALLWMSKSTAKAVNSPDRVPFKVNTDRLARYVGGCMKKMNGGE